MESNCCDKITREIHLGPLTRDWGAWNAVSMYLNRCQVDTPEELVKATWAHVSDLRPEVGKVVDFGAGDARFARYGKYKQYIGYEIDPGRCDVDALPRNATVANRCAFSDDIYDADLCIGNPPFVRNQDLPVGWRQQASSVLRRRTDVAVSGLANAWQYFFLLALASLKDDGLCALILPYEWVSRPSVKRLREYILLQRWNVSVYRLVDTTFNSVLTTSSITIVDKARREGIWSYFEETATGKYIPLPSPTTSHAGVIKYLRRSDINMNGPRAMRGLSPGTQKVLTLTEGERVRMGLEVCRDVVPCVTTLRPLPSTCQRLDEQTFNNYYRSPGEKCWLIRTDSEQSPSLQGYLNAVPSSAYQTSTCLCREVWWKFNMPPVPDVLVGTSFKGKFPKSVENSIKARAVGGVCGVYGLNELKTARFLQLISNIDIRDRIVAHSNGLRKLEINQLNMMLRDIFPKGQADNA